MSKAKLRAATVGGSADDIEAAFYEALQKGDLEKLMACWADEDDIVCVHPGGPRIIGATAIRASFEAMFENGGAILAKPMNVRKVETITSAMHNWPHRKACKPALSWPPMSISARPRVGAWWRTTPVPVPRPK